MADASFAMKRDTRKSTVQTRIEEMLAEGQEAQEKDPGHHLEGEGAGKVHTQEVFHTIEKEKIKHQDPPEDTTASPGHTEINQDPTARAVTSTLSLPEKVMNHLNQKVVASIPDQRALMMPKPKPLR